MTKVTPVILCGGAGARLWPASRESLPKPFLKLVGEQSILGATLERVASGDVWGDPLVVAGEEHRFWVSEALRDAGLSGSILLEPEGRDSAGAIAAAAAFVASRGPDSVMMVLPADHVMADVTAVGRLVEQGLAAAEAGRIVVFGLKPSRPETGYGYIRADGEIVTWSGVRKVVAFAEKPDAVTAKAYVGEGCLWNSGMFMMRADVGLAEIRRLHPAVASVAEAAVASMTKDLEFHRLPRAPWREMPRLSFDHAVMESTDRAVVVEADFDWSDIGNWQSVWQVLEKDSKGNVTIGEVQLRDSQRSLVRSDRLFVGAIGLDDFMVVASDDAVLVAPLARAGEVKLLVDDLRRRNSTIVSEHPRVHRPWGYYESIHRGDRHQVKRICVKPGARLSLQMHHHRAEHWVVVAGTAMVTRGETSELIQENESIYIPFGTAHRLHNPGKIPLEVIEVQSGSYLGEDDIVRFEDDYQRA